MKRVLNFLFVLAMALTFGGCAGFARGCSAGMAENFGSDWIIVQYSGMGEPFRCWELRGVSVANEEGSDGIYWQSEDGHLVHLSGHYNRVQVSGGAWDSAFSELGFTPDRCRQIQSGER